MTYLHYAEATLQKLDALWTAREIQQQPQSWQHTLCLLEQQRDTIEQFIAPLLAQADMRIILTGAGTSAFIGNSLAPLLMHHLQQRVEAIATTDLVSNPEQFFQPQVPTLLVSFARSGNSPESVAAVDYCEQLVTNSYQLAVTCNATGALYKRCQGQNRQALLMPTETNDVSFAMTSSFTSMLLAALWVFCQNESFQTELKATMAATQHLLQRQAIKLKALANRQFKRVVFLGSGCLKGTAQESALKLLELTDGKTIATFDSPLGFRHGPKAILNADTLVFVLISNDRLTCQYDLELLQELQNDAEVGQLIAISAKQHASIQREESILLEGLSQASDALLMFPYIVCAQVYAFHHALGLGNTPDNPSASGTINRVVQGVKIHAL